MPAHASCNTGCLNTQDDKSRRSGRRSEADSEEAIQDVCALSQEGSLGSFSGSDRSFARRIEAAAESVPPTCLLSKSRNAQQSTFDIPFNSICWRSWHVQNDTPGSLVNAVADR